ncbi:hypothetical protein JMN32_09640 [Fulvivirga sp. 29W222]|uniref:Uncharacterized protein n=1 Tax=Fulvivirga marina TaxID=2494733 RepID=A0A937FX05_9BACT|nr:hypothetical protein [Fulvivirga marina]MBL6446572.1 hypothetical protein [Fulvivirga marina]
MILISLQGTAQGKLKISGGINATAMRYGVSGIEARRDPFYWLLSGNLTFSYKGISAPFSATISQQDQSFRYPLPFNQFGISPTYKFVTLHLGYRSMQFSEFTYGGNIFLGAGIEVSPENIPVRVSGFYGRLAKARLEGNINDLEFGLPSFERWAYGSKVTLVQKKGEVDIISFRAKDDRYSINDSITAELGITPSENLVLGLNLKREILERVSFSAEYALSAFTSDIRSPETELRDYKYAENVGGLFTPRVSSQFNGAYKGELVYSASSFQFGLKYRRIDPEYRTLGSPFLINDIEDISGTAGWRMFKRKLSLSTSAGVQRNNLNGDQESDVRRFIGSLNSSLSLANGVNVTAGYSNFSTSSTLTQFFQQSEFDQIDTLLYLQVTNSINSSISYNFGSESIKKSLSLNGSYQNADDNQDNLSVFYNGNVGYTVNYTERNLNLSTNFNVNSNEVNGVESLSGGPSLMASRLLLEKLLRVSVSSSLIQSYNQGSLISTNIIARLNGSLKYKQKHVFSMDLSLLRREANVEGVPSFSEFRGGITYNFNFSN